MKAKEVLETAKQVFKIFPYRWTLSMLGRIAIFCVVSEYVDTLVATASIISRIIWCVNLTGLVIYLFPELIDLMTEMGKSIRDEWREKRGER